jgi:REP element-mobilizing transposase RayT
MRTASPGHLKTFDYLGFQRYFLTFCTKDRERVFLRHQPVDLVRTQILRAAENEQFAIVVDCFMPDHVHLLAEGLTETADGLRFIAGQAIQRILLFEAVWQTALAAIRI